MAQSNLINMKACLFSMFSFFAIMYNYNDLNEASFLNHSFSTTTNIIFGICLFVLFSLFYKQVITRVCSFSSHSKIIGIFAGIINVLGRNFVLYNGMQFFYKDVLFAVVFSLLAAIGYGIIYASVFELGWWYLKVQREKGLENKNSSSFINTVNHIIFDKHPLLYPFLLICLFWLPYFISFFPGMLQWDAAVALLGHYGVTVKSNHHPVIGTLVMVYIMDIGKYFGNDNYGCVIYVILQYFLLSISLAYSFVFFNRWKINYIFRWLVLLFFMLHPVFPTFVMNVVKDVLYYIAYLWLLYLFIRCYEEHNKALVFYIFISSMLLCTLRKEGLVICIICSIAFLLFQESIYEKWKNILNAIILGIVFALFISFAALVYYNYERSSIKEAFSIPLQQTARYIRDHSVDITESEWVVLNNIFQNKANTLGMYYEPELSDSVKDQIDNRLFKEQITAYIRVWGNHFFRHPDCYLAAAFNHMYGYFYIGKEAMFKIGDCRTENFVKGDNLYSEKLRIVDNPRTINFRKSMTKYIYSWPDFPLIGILYRPAVYTWILLFGLSYLIHLKKFNYLFLYCMPLVVLCICCLSPANAFIRYIYPVIISCFILLAFDFRLELC